MKLFDGHCDTAYELWTRGEGLARNSCHIDLQKAAGLEAYAQVFAFCSNAGRPGGGTERLLTEPLALLCPRGGEEPQPHRALPQTVRRPCA